MYLNWRTKHQSKAMVEISSPYDRRRYQVGPVETGTGPPSTITDEMQNLPSTDQCAIKEDISSAFDALGKI